jgi:TatD DNase family protein
MFDSHCHIQFPAFDKDRGEVIDRAHTAGVKMIAVGTQLSTSEDALAFAEKYPGEIWATVGYHPNHLSEAWHHDSKEQKVALRERFDAEAFRKLAAHPAVVGIGECGLDYYRLINNNQQLIIREKKIQKEVFLAQAEIAKEVGKPLMIHCRPRKGTDDAYEDLLAQFSILNFQFPKIVHFYVGSPAMTKKLIDAGFYFTFGGVITFLPRLAERSRVEAGSRGPYDEIINIIPLDRILAETDAPYVAPEPYRGKRNEPGYVVEVVKKLAELKKVSNEKMAEHVEKNARTVFYIA